LRAHGARHGYGRAAAAQFELSNLIAAETECRGRGQSAIAESLSRLAQQFAFFGVASLARQDETDVADGGFVGKLGSQCRRRREVLGFENDLAAGSPVLDFAFFVGVGPDAVAARA